MLIAHKISLLNYLMFASNVQVMSLNKPVPTSVDLEARPPATINWLSVIILRQDLYFCSGSGGIAVNVIPSIVFSTLFWDAAYSREQNI
jgi:hypothetical protein